MVDFHIASGELGTVTNEIAAAAGRPIAFPAALAVGRRAGPVVGRKSVRAALSEALAGTGLVVIAGEAGPITIRAVTTSTRASTSTTSTTAARVSSVPLELPDIDVEGIRARFGDDGFQAGDAGQTTRLPGVSAREIPLTVTSVTKDVIRSQGVTTATDALINVAGVVATPTGFGVPAFTIRGFSTAGTYIDGDPSLGTTNATVPIDDIERVDVLKGTTSILTGTTADGGLVNVVTKAPTDRTVRDVTVRYGSNGYKTLAFDFGGVIPQTEGLTYRLVASGNDADRSYGGYKNPHEYLLAPSLQWQDDTTSILVGARYFDVKSAPPTFTFIPLGAPIDDTAIIRTPRGVAEVNPNVFVANKNASLFSDQSHRFEAFHGLDITVANHVQYQTQETYSPYFFWGQDQVRSSYGYQPARLGLDLNNLAERADVTAHYATASFRETAKVGFDFLQADTLSKSAIDPEIYINPYTGQVDPTIRVSPGSTITTTTALKSSDTGVYFLDKLDVFNDRLHIVGNVRQDHFESGTTSVFAFGPVSQSQKSHVGQSDLSWVAGGAFDVAPWMTVYGNRASGFVPQTGISQASEAVGPQGRDQSEVGSRFYLFDKRLTASASYYTLDQTNVAIASPTDPTGIQSILIPGQTSRGFEFEAQGQVFPGLDVIVGFADADVALKTANDTAFLQGAPQLVGSLWATYTLQSGPLAGFVVGAGVHGNTSSQTEGFDANFDGVDYRVPGYVVEDAMIGYVRGDYAINLKLNNLGNAYFFYPSISGSQIVVGQGRNFLLTARRSF